MEFYCGYGDEKADVMSACRVNSAWDENPYLVIL
jgi:hypothetical protein